MAALHEKYLWPLIGVIIFAVLAAFYFDDRRRLAQEEIADTQDKQTTTAANSKSQTETKYGSDKDTNKLEQSKMAASDDNSSTHSHDATSMSLEEYLAATTAERSGELEANVAEHKGFSGSIEDYLGGKHKTQTVMKSQSTRKSTYATSMSIDGYLEKFGDGKQTPISNPNDDPFNKQEHQGFHGSYEEYAKKFN